MNSSLVTVPKYGSEISFDHKSIAGDKTSNQMTTTTSATRIAPAVKFSDDIEKWQKIYKIRKSPVGAQVKLVIDLLLQSRQSFTAEQINEACYVADKAVLETLANNPKVCYDGNRFSYKSKYNVRDQKELLGLIQKSAEGIVVADLKDAYPSVMEDLQALKAEGQICLVSKSNSKEEIVYPSDHRVPFMKVDDELKELFRSIKLPCDMLVIERDLQKNGMKPATNTANRRIMAQNGNVFNEPKEETRKKRKFKISKRTKLTNSHLPELIKDLYG